VRINLVVNTHRPDATEAARKTATHLREHRVEVGCDREGAELVGVGAVADDRFGEADLAISFGGDGTLIRTADLCSERGTPILGVYYGRFGFVTQCRPNEIGAALSQFFDGQARIEERMMVQTELFRSGQSVGTIHALNEAALLRAATTRMLTFEVSVDGRRLTKYPADGVMVATPTGSTAYNLSAGGPVIDPTLSALILTAITPHTLSARSLILRPDSEIRLGLETRGDAVLSCDGQTRLHVLSGDEVRVTRSPRITRLISLAPQDFLEKLSDKLLWSQGLSEVDD